MFGWCCKNRCWNVKTDTSIEDCVIQAQVEHQVPEGRQFKCFFSSNFWFLIENFFHLLVENIEFENQNEEHEASEEESVVDNGNLVAWKWNEFVL